LAPKPGVPQVPPMVATPDAVMPLMLALCTQLLPAP
jgi:hypothetical protein